MYYAKDFVNGVLSGISTVKVTASFNEILVIGDNAFRHMGIDMTPTAYVNPITYGKVSKVGYDASMGNYIFIEHGEGFESRYEHLAHGTTTVKEGDKVDRIKQIAKSGATGKVTGAHLHFGLFKDGKPIDPLEYLQGKKVVPPYEEVIMTRPDLPMLKVLISQLNYRDKPNGTKIGQLTAKDYIYLGKSQMLGGYEWAEILLDGKIVYCALNKDWNEVRLPKTPPILFEMEKDGFRISTTLSQL